MNNIIDSVILRYDKMDESKLSKLSQWLSSNYSTTYEERVKANGIKRYTCKIKNLIISVDARYFYIKGSIQKFYIGNNVENIPQKDIYKAIDLLNKSLGNIIDIKEAFVRRLDVGINLCMDNNPAAYINKFHTASVKTPYYYNNQTISIGNKSRGILIYDKTSEVKNANRKLKTNVDVPENLIRIESFIKGRKVFEKHFGVQLPTVEMILQRVDSLPDILINEYININKERDVSIDRIRNQKDLLHYTIISTGYSKCEQVINYSFSLGEISKQSRYRLHNTVKAAYEQLETSSTVDLIGELDEKVLDWYHKVK